MKSVQYLRPYTVDELATLQQQVQRVFVETPSFVAAAVLMQELHKRLTTNLHEEPADSPAPEPIEELIQCLDRCRTTFIKISHKGITREEHVS